MKIKAARGTVTHAGMPQQLPERRSGGKKCPACRSVPGKISPTWRQSLARWIL